MQLAPIRHLKVIFIHVLMCSVEAKTLWIGGVRVSLNFSVACLVLTLKLSGLESNVQPFLNLPI